MVDIPDDRPEQGLAELIYSAREREEVAQRKGRGYLPRIGASSIGDACLRRVFFEWRGYAGPGHPHRGRVLRLFETGHLQEARIVADLRRVGLAVWDVNPETGKQFTYIDPETGHFVDKIDGVVRGLPGAPKTPHLLEVKTHNDKSFVSVMKLGVLKSKPEHYAQVQAGMWLTGLERALYVALNKNDENYYFERIKRDPVAIKDGVKERVATLYNATLIPAGISTDASAYGCTFCPFKDACVGGLPAKNCRTCRHAEPAEGGEWLCNLHQEVLSYGKQLAGCEDWDPLKAERGKL